MNIAIIGYGRMGHEIESAAIERGHSVKITIDLANPWDLNSEKFKEIDAAIEFSSPDSALGNILKCLEMQVPVVSGTTGWLENYDRAAETCKKYGTSFIHSSNFSIGVNIFFRLNSQLAKYMNGQKNYSPHIEEIHHTKKLDAPSGTAITLANGISSNHSEYEGWCFDKERISNRIPISSVREGTVPGTHTVMWDSDIDSLSLIHEAKNRRGLALGAVVAAEFIYSKKGIFTMNDVMGF
jgi:4-hydroxy-tetrahydrodipicolinate reductase